MNINNLGGARAPVSTNTSQTAQTARASFGTLLKSGAGAPAAGRTGVPGSSIVSTAISINSGAVPGSGVGAPYQQAMPSTPAASTATAAPGTTASAGTSTAAAGTMSPDDQKKALQELVKASMMSFVSSTFSMGQNRPGIEALDD